MSKELERVRAEMQALHYQLLMDEVSDEYRDNFDKVVKRRYELLDQILKIKGLCIESDNQELPKTEWHVFPIAIVNAYEDAQQDMLKSNFRRVIE